MDANNKSKLDALLQRKVEQADAAKQKKAEETEQQVAALNIFREIASSTIRPVLNEYAEYLRTRSVKATAMYEDEGAGTSPEDPHYTFTVPLPGVSYGRHGPSAISFRLNKYRSVVWVHERISTAGSVSSTPGGAEMSLSEVNKSRVEDCVTRFLEKVLTAE